MLESETWIDSDNYKEYKLSCSIIENTEPMRIAASIGDRHFKNIPQRILNMNKNAEAEMEEVKNEEVAEEVTEETKEEVSAEVVEEVKEE